MNDEVLLVTFSWNIWLIFCLQIPGLFVSSKSKTNYCETTLKISTLWSNKQALSGSSSVTVRLLRLPASAAVTVFHPLKLRRIYWNSASHSAPNVCSPTKTWRQWRHQRRLWNLILSSSGKECPTNFTVLWQWTKKLAIWLLSSDLPWKSDLLL